MYVCCTSSRAPRLAAPAPAPSRRARRTHARPAPADGIEDGSEVFVGYTPRKPEKESVPRERDFHHLDALLVREPGVPSTGMLKRVLSARGRQCQVCWRSRWFRAEVLQIYSTSLLCRWLDWPDHEWPHFFVRVKLANAPGVPPDMEDETWRVRWHESLSVSQLPIVQPKFGELPPLSWVKSFLRTYASADELSLVRELQVRAAPSRARALPRTALPADATATPLPRQAHLPKEIVEARNAAASRHRCILLGASGVGKTTLVSTLCKGPPELGGLGAPSDVAGGVAGKGAAPKFWPTVGTRCREAMVNTPGCAASPRPAPPRLTERPGAPAASRRCSSRRGTRVETCSTSRSRKSSTGR